MEMRDCFPLIENLKTKRRKQTRLPNRYKLLKVKHLYNFKYIEIAYPLQLFRKKVASPLQDTPTSDVFSLRP